MGGGREELLNYHSSRKYTPPLRQSQERLSPPFCSKNTPDSKNPLLAAQRKSRVAPHLAFSTQNSGHREPHRMEFGSGVGAGAVTYKKAIEAPCYGELEPCPWQPNHSPRSASSTCKGHSPGATETQGGLLLGARK